MMFDRPHPCFMGSLKGPLTPASQLEVFIRNNVNTITLFNGAVTLWVHIHKRGWRTLVQYRAVQPQRNCGVLSDEGPHQ